MGFAKSHLKASRSSSSLSAPFIFLDIICRNSLNSMVPLPSWSTSFTMSRSSVSVDTREHAIISIERASERASAHNTDRRTQTERERPTQVTIGNRRSAAARPVAHGEFRAALQLCGLFEVVRELVMKGAGEYLWARWWAFYFPIGVCMTCIPEGLWPRERITTPNSAMVMVPSSSLSNNMNASLNSVNQTQYLHTLYQKL